MDVELIPAYSHKEEVKTLFSEYKKTQDDDWSVRKR